MKTIEKIFSRMISNKTLVCVGLDPDITKIPFEITEKKISNEEKVYEFLQDIIDITSSHVCVYKAQKAFFDLLPGGHTVLKEIINYIHSNYDKIPIILDCKIGDIENTMQAYIDNIFGNLEADGVVANPYMGNDVIIPLAELSDKAIVVLAQTSNPTSALIQNITLEKGCTLWRYILDLIIEDWNYNNNMIPVISSNYNSNITEIRNIIPDTMPILLAGVGVQGGDYKKLHSLLNSDKIGVFVNSSRGILYPKDNQIQWMRAVENAVIRLKTELNIVRGGNYE